MMALLATFELGEAGERCGEPLRAHEQFAKLLL